MDGGIRDLYAQDVRTVSLAQARHIGAAPLASLTAMVGSLLCVPQVKRFRQDVGNFDGRPVSRWLGAEAEQRAVFVDESTCGQGCLQRVHCPASSLC